MFGFTFRVGLEVIRGLRAKRLKFNQGPMIIEGRAWPMDCDFFLHLNNASYARRAELERWRSLGASGMLHMIIKSRWQFLIAEQSLIYKKQIPIFTKFLIKTSISISDSKWLHYVHHFTSIDDNIHFATVTVKAVLKHPSGKTISPNTFLNNS